MMQKAWAGRVVVASRFRLGSIFDGGKLYGSGVEVINARPSIARAGWLSTQAHKGENSSPVSEKQEGPGGNPAERMDYREDMSISYGEAYSTRSSEEGYGERYGEAVKAVLEKREDKMEMQRGETAERDQTLDSVANVEFDHTQGEPVAQREKSRHSL